MKFISILRGMLAAAISVLTFAGPANAMVNGTNIPNDPLSSASGFVVAIEAYKTKGATSYKRCLGAAVADDAIITAGHCLTGTEYVLVKFMEATSPLQFDVIPAKGWTIHPQYNGGYPEPMYSKYIIAESENYHDIAVIVMERPSQYARPVNVVPASWNPTSDRTVPPRFYVFGQARDEIYKSVNEIQFTTFDKAAKVADTKHWMTGITPPDVLICNGDSGSPVTVSSIDEAFSGPIRHLLVGIQTSGDGLPVKPKNVEAALKYWKSVDNFPLCTRDFSFVSVAQHAEWIADELEKLDPGMPRPLRVVNDKAGQHGLTEDGQPRDRCSYHISPAMCRQCMSGTTAATSFCKGLIK